MDGLEVQLHPWQGEDSLGLVVVGGRAAEAAEQAGVLGGGAALRVVSVHIPQQVQL